MNERISPCENTGVLASAVTALFFCGVFSIEGTQAYALNIPVFLAVPLSLLLSLAPVLLASFAMRRAGIHTLHELIRTSLGRAVGSFASILLAAGALFASVNPLADCVQVLHKLVYDGAAYRRILAFLLVPLLVLCVKGFKCITRTALVFAIPLGASVAAAVITAVPGFEPARLYPFPGCSSRDFIRFTASYRFAFLPALTAPLAFPFSSGISLKTPVKAALTAFAFIAVSLLAVRLCYPSVMLVGLSMPLYRIGLMRPGPGFLLRLDKLFIMVWLSGSLISASFLMRFAVELVSAVFDLRKKVIPASLLPILAVLAVLALCHGKGIAAAAREALYSGGALLTSVPLYAASLISFIKRRRT